MSQQRSLPFDRIVLPESLRAGLPAQAREQVVVLYAGLILRGARSKLGATPQPAASASRGLVGHAAPESVDAVLGGEVPAKGSPEAGLDITIPPSTDPGGVPFRHFDASNTI